jgi:hypothetical protein
VNVIPREDKYCRNIAPPAESVIGSTLLSRCPAFQAGFLACGERRLPRRAASPRSEESACGHNWLFKRNSPRRDLAPPLFCYVLENRLPTLRTHVGELDSVALLICPGHHTDYVNGYSRKGQSKRQLDGFFCLQVAHVHLHSPLAEVPTHSAACVGIHYAGHLRPHRYSLIRALILEHSAVPSLPFAEELISGPRGALPTAGFVGRNFVSKEWLPALFRSGSHSCLLPVQPRIQFFVLHCGFASRSLFGPRPPPHSLDDPRCRCATQACQTQ